MEVNVKLTRNWLGLGVVFLSVALFNSVVSLSVEAAPRNRKAIRQLSAGELAAETARRAEAAAEQAREEARSARLENEALRQQLTQLAQELAALRQAQQQTDYSRQLDRKSTRLNSSHLGI